MFFLQQNSPNIEAWLENSNHTSTKLHEKSGGDIPKEDDIDIWLEKVKYVICLTSNPLNDGL